MKDLKTRSLFGLIGAALLVFAVYHDRLLSIAVFGAILILGLVEIFLLNRKVGRIVSAVSAFLGFSGAVLFLTPPEYFIDLSFMILLFAILFLFVAPKLLIWMYSIIVVVGAMSAVSIRLDHGAKYVVAVLFLTWAADVGAYIVGMKFGRHFMAPSISPGKTWEGALGGIAAPILVAFVFAAIYGELFLMLLFALAAGTVGQLGDLVESKVKRIVGVKDSGSLIPGHGGVLDRFDAFLFNACAALFILVRVPIH